MHIVQNYFKTFILSSKILKKKKLCSIVPPTKLAQAVSSIFSPKIQLGPNLQQSTTKMAVARPKCDADSSEVFQIIDNII